MIFKRKFMEISGVKGAIYQRRKGETLSGEIVLLGGRSVDTDGKEGISSLLSSLFNRGCEDLNYEEIVGELERMGSSISASAGTDSITITFWTMKEFVAETIDILLKCLSSPRFPQDELEKEIERQVNEMKRTWDIPEIAASKIFQHRVFGSHPYSKHEKEITLRRISREELLDRKEKEFRRKRAIVVISGSHPDSEGILKRVVDMLDGEGERFSMRLPKLHEGRKIYFYQKENAEQTQIRMGHPSFPRSFPNYEEAVIFNYILGGGGFSSRLMEKIRAKGGLTYSVRSSFTPMLFGGLFSISTFTKPENTDEIIEEIIKEIERTLREGVTREEVEKAKGYYLGHFPLELETPVQIGSLLSEILFYGLKEEYPEEFIHRIKNIRAEDINFIAPQLIKPDSFVITAVGNKEAKEKLGKLGKVEEVIPE